jgi:glycosyltransferase involved in cell wall biosynthesis
MAQLDILIPHYNDLKGLTLSLDSVAAQTWDGEYRVVIADDGSSDDVTASLEKLVDKYSYPIIVLRSPINRGRPFTRNVLLDAIESPYTTWLDSGDEFYPQKLAVQFLAITKSEAASRGPRWVTCHYDWKRLGDDRPRKIMQLTEQDQVKALLIGRNLRAYLWTFLCRSNSLKDLGWFDEKLPRLQDLDYCLRFIMRGGILVDAGVEESLCLYHKAYLGREADELRRCYAYIYDKHRDLYSRYGSAFARWRLYHMEMHSALFAANNGDAVKSAYYMWRGFCVDPFRFTARVLIRGFRP